MPPIISEKISRLENLLNRMEKNIWQICDLLVDLVDVDKKPLKEIASHFLDAAGEVDDTRSYSRLSQYYSTGKQFKENQRRDDLSFSAHDAVRQSVKKVQGNVKSELMREYVIDPHMVLAGLPVGCSTREVSSIIREQARKDSAPIKQENASKAIAKMVAGSVKIDKCYNSDYAEVLANMPDESIKLALLDPPYAHYDKSGCEGGLDHNTTIAADTECENATQEDAIRTTCAAFPLLAKKLQKNGAIVLWQAARHLRVPIIQAIEASGFEILLPWIWNKKRPAPRNYESPNTYSTEFAWLIRRKGDTVTNLDGSPRMQIIEGIKPLHQDSMSIKHTHVMEKPVELGTFILGKLTVENDLVFIGFGCYGSEAVACIQNNRRFVWCEKHSENFIHGSAKIEAEFGRPNNSLTGEDAVAA